MSSSAASSPNGDDFPHHPWDSFRAHVDNLHVLGARHIAHAHPRQADRTAFAAALTLAFAPNATSDIRAHVGVAEFVNEAFHEFPEVGRALLDPRIVRGRPILEAVREVCDQTLWAPVLRESTSPVQASGLDDSAIGSSYRPLIDHPTWNSVSVHVDNLKVLTAVGRQALRPQIAQSVVAIARTLVADGATPSMLRVDMYLATYLNSAIKEFPEIAHALRWPCVDGEYILDVIKSALPEPHLASAISDPTIGAIDGDELCLA